MDLQIAHRLHTEIQEASHISENIIRYRTDYSDIMQAERDRDHPGSSAQRSYPLIRSDTAKAECIIRSRISKREEQSHDIRSTRKSQI